MKPSIERPGGNGWAITVSGWAEQHSKLLISAFIVITALLAVPAIVMDTPEQASQDPPGRIFDLQKRVDDVFAAPVHAVPFIAEAKSGDILTAESLSELLLAETLLQSADQKLELGAEDAPSEPLLLTYFDHAAGRSVTGIFTIADAVEEYLRATSNGELSLFEATDEQVKVAIHRLLLNGQSAELAEFFSVQATSEPVIVDGEEVNWWTSPALQFNVIADNNLLGGGTQAIGVSADERTLEKEEFNRNVQEILRQQTSSLDLWGIAVDANLESAEEGQESGVFITFTVIAAIAIVGIALRSYWAVALTGIGLGALMVWLKGISLLVGIKGGLVIDLIVPIAMVSLGVDFAVHALRRYQEERRQISVPRRALVIGLGGVLPALVLAMASDGIAFLSNTSSGIEAVIHFGLAAAIATASSFLVLGIVVPQAYAIVDDKLTGRSYTGWLNRSNIVLSSFGAASAAGGAVILLVAVSPLIGTAFLAVALVLTVVVPGAYLHFRSSGDPDPGEKLARDPSADDVGTHAIDRLVTLTNYRYALLATVAGLTALAGFYAMKLEATFDVKDFFSSSSDFAVSLDKLDEHVGERSGEPATVVIEGDFSDPGALSSIQAVFDNMDRNQNLGRNTLGTVNISEPNVLQIILDTTASPAGRAGVFEMTGVEIGERTPYGFPETPEQISAVLDYAVQAGVPTSDGDLAYTAASVRSVLQHNPLGNTLDLTRFTVFLPGTREQAQVERAKASIEQDLQSLDSSDSITDYGVTGSPIMRQAQLEATTESLQTSIPIAAIAALALLLIVFRSVRFAVVTIIPIGLVVVWLYAIMYLSGFALNFVTATIGAVSIGVGIDFSIHLTQRFREELRRSVSRVEAMTRALRGTGVALAGSSASSIIGFAIMGLAPMPLFASYGLLTSMMVFLAVLAALVVLPSLLLIVTPELQATSKSTANENKARP